MEHALAQVDVVPVEAERFTLARAGADEELERVGHLGVSPWQCTRKRAGKAAPPHGRPAAGWGGDADGDVPRPVLAEGEQVRAVCAELVAVGAGVQQAALGQDADRTALVENTAAHITGTLAAGLPGDSAAAYAQVQELARECRFVLGLALDTPATDRA